MQNERLETFLNTEPSSSMFKDTIYKTPRHPVPPFEFDAQVAAVFNDMIQRSVPAYAEIIRRQVQLAMHYYQPGTRIYDLGCSTGNLGIGLCRQMPETGFDMIAVDNSRPMLDSFQERLGMVPRPERVRLVCGDARRTPIEKASVVVLNYTLQFLPLNDRPVLLKTIAAGLVRGGVLLFSEKTIHGDARLARLQQDFYHGFKRENGYSELEISQKREALEKVLIPETLECHLERLRLAGFGPVEIWHKWFYFAAFIALRG